MAFGMGLVQSFLKPENDDEMKLVLSLANEAAKKYGQAPSPDIKGKVQQGINQALSAYRNRSWSQRQTGPQVSANLTNELERWDPSQDLMVNPIEPPQIADRVGRAENIYGIQTRQAYDKASEPWDIGKMTTFEKVAGGAGAAAALLGAAGVGGANRRNPLAAVSKLGLGYAMGSPDRYRQNQDRTLQGELGAAQGTRFAGLAEPQAELQQFGLDNAYNQDLYGRGEDRANLSLASGRLQQRDKETEAWYGGKTPAERDIPLDKQILNQAYIWIRDGVFTPATLPQPYRDRYNKALGTGVEDARRVRRATSEFSNKATGFAQQLLGSAKQTSPDRYGEWQSNEGTMDDLYGLIKSGEIGKRIPQSFAGIDLLAKDTFEPDPGLLQLKDSASFYGNEANLPGYINERLADPNWVAREGQQQGPDALAAEWGFPDVQSAIADLESKKGQMTPETYQKYRQILGY